MVEKEIARAVINAGVGGVIAALVIYLAYRMTSGLAFRVGMKMVAAFESQAEAITKQAASMEGLTESIRDFVNRDASEHREMLVLLKFIAQDRRRTAVAGRDVNLSAGLSPEVGR